VKKIDFAISNGYHVVIWPKSIAEKDINAMVLAGRSPEKIKSIIDGNTYGGVAARLRFVDWKK
jgi:hypothetical protein